MKAMTVTELNTHLIGLVRNERKITLEIISYLSLFERCGGHLKMGYGSMHDYMTRGLGYSDDQTYRRLKAARLYHQVPEVADKLNEGSLNLAQISEAQKSFELAQKETGTPVSLEKKREILESIAYTNNFQTKAILSEELNLKPIEAERTKPQSDQTVRIEITLTQEQFEKLTEIKSLLSHKVPGQGTADVLNILFDQFLSKKVFTAKQKEADEPSNADAPNSEGIDSDSSPPALAVKNSPHRSRYIPASIRRIVYQRAHGCCEHVEQGVRCNSRYQLEIDHCNVPFALGGTHELNNLRMVCSRHNAYSASQQNLGLELTSYFLSS